MKADVTLFAPRAAITHPAARVSEKRAGQRARVSGERRVVMRVRATNTGRPVIVNRLDVACDLPSLNRRPSLTARPPRAHSNRAGADIARKAGARQESAARPTSMRQVIPRTRASRRSDSG